MTDNASIRLTRTAIPYDEFGGEYRVWEVEFADLHIEVRGGEAQRFGVWGLGRERPGTEGKTYSWFNLASNAALSDTAAAGSENLLLMFDPAAAEFKLISRQKSAFDDDPGVFSHPAFVGRKMFLRGSQEIVCLDLE